MEYTLSTNGHVHYPEEPEEKNIPAWLYPIAAAFYVFLAAFSAYFGWNVAGLIW
jgi:hypothetical protein